MDDISIREFEASDLAAVKSLVDSTIDLCYSDVYPEEAIRFFKAYHSHENILSGVREGYTVILEKDRQIIGTGTVIGNHIMRVFIDPKFQGRGYGKLIMRTLEEKACSNGINTVILDSSLVSKRFYDAIGYTTLRETFLPLENDQRLDYYEMKKSLIKSP